MIVSITKIELNSYLRLIPFFKFNGQITKELKLSTCKGFKLTPNFNLKVWYTMTLWDNDTDINNFYRNDTHLEAMKKSTIFSSKIQSKRIDKMELINWKDAKKLFNTI